jgi:hypothetical protein
MYNKDYILYTWNHKLAFLKVEKIVLGKNTVRGYLHDIEKLFLYTFLPKKAVSKLHRNISRHHIKRARTKNDFIQMIIDWECARLTKADKPLNALDTLYKFYPQLESTILPIYKELDMGTKTKLVDKMR